VLATEPPSATYSIGDDLSQLIGEASSDPGLAQTLAADLEKFMLAVQTHLGLPDEGELRRSAVDGDWSAVLRTAAIALRSRLTGEG